MWSLVRDYIVEKSLTNPNCGSGRITWRSGSTYLGDFEDELPNGGGTFTGVKGDTCMSLWLSYHTGRYGEEIILWRNVQKYMGGWKKGVPHGEGSLSWFSGSTYAGDFAEGLPNGSGTYRGVKGDKSFCSWLSCHMDSPRKELITLWRDVREYGGNWKKGIPHGEGSLYWHSGAKYGGEISNGLPNGSGMFTGIQGDICMSAWLFSHMEGGWRETDIWVHVQSYGGYWKDGIPNVEGTVCWFSGSSYGGQLKSSLPHGSGTFTWKDGCKYGGYWRMGRFSREGKFTWPNGISYCGHWKDGEPKGEGLLTWTNGKRYTINWEQMMNRNKFWNEWGAEGCTTSTASTAYLRQEHNSTEIQNYNSGIGAGCLNQNRGPNAGSMNLGPNSGSTNIHYEIKVYCRELYRRGANIGKE